MSHFRPDKKWQIPTSPSCLLSISVYAEDSTIWHVLNVQQMWMKEIIQILIRWYIWKEENKPSVLHGSWHSLCYPTVQARGTKVCSSVSVSPSGSTRVTQPRAAVWDKQNTSHCANHSRSDLVCNWIQSSIYLTSYRKGMFLHDFTTDC